MIIRKKLGRQQARKKVRKETEEGFLSLLMEAR